jgi:hypothetical protein
MQPTYHRRAVQAASSIGIRDLDIEFHGKAGK